MILLERRRCKKRGTSFSSTSWRMSPAKRVFTMRQRSLARTETRQPHFDLNRRGRALGFLIHFRLREQ